MSSSHRSLSYSIQEDIHLCHVYLDVSQNPIVGINQSKDQFWARVEADYHLDPMFQNQPRPRRSLQSRMSVIINAISKLRGCVRQIENLKPSGASEEDIVSYCCYCYCILPRLFLILYIYSIVYFIDTVESS